MWIILDNKSKQIAIGNATEIRYQASFTEADDGIFHVGWGLLIGSSVDVPMVVGFNTEFGAAAAYDLLIEAIKGDLPVVDFRGLDSGVDDKVRGE